MKREDLKALGLEEEVINKIMALHGTSIESKKKDIDSLKTEVETLKTTNETYKSQMNETNEKIKEFENMDIDSIKKSADEIKKQHETQITELQEKLSQQAYDFQVKEYLTKFEYTNDLVKEAIESKFKQKGFKLEDGKFLGADDYMKDLKESQPTAFVQEEDEKDKKPSFGKPNSNNDSGTKDSYSESMRKAIFGR